MAYAIKYLFKFESSNGTTREIRVLQDGYTGEVIQRPLGRAPILKKQQNGPVHGTSLEFYAECNVDREFIEFYTSDPKAYRVDLYAGATLLWQGYITPELYSEPDIAPPYDVQVVATDGVGELKLYDYAAQGAVTLRALLSGLLSRTGLGTDIYLISSLKPGSAGAGSLLEKTINLDYMAGNSCYEVLTYILDTLHATITWWKGAWILSRETNVTFTNGKVRYFNTAGNSALLNDSVQVLGKMYANPAWPVGQLSTVIDPAKNRVTVQAPWHVVTCLRNSDMTSDASWAKSNDASYGPDGYLFPNNDEGASTYATAYISQALAMEGLRVPMSFELRATGVSAQVGVRVGAVIGVLLTYTVGNVVYHLRKGSEGTPEWTPGPAIGTTIDGSLVDYQRPLASFDMDRIQAETLQITDIPAFVQGTSYPSGTLTVYILGTCARVYAATLDVVLPKGYQDILRIDNGARGEGGEVEIAIGRVTADNAYYAAFLQGLLLDSGNLITSFSDANFPGGMDYLAFIARDYALSVALPRAKVTGTVYLESGIAAPPLVFTKGALNYWLQTWSWNLYEDELEIEGLTLPSASLTVESETILESNGSTVSSAGGAGSSSAGSSMGGGVGTNYWEIDGTLNTLLKPKDAYAYVHSKDGLFFTGAALSGTVVPDLYVDTVNNQRVLRSPLPLITGGDQIVIDGTPGGGGGGGGATTLAGLDDTNITNPQAGQMLAWNGTKWVNTNAPTGSITSVALAAGESNGTLLLVVNGTAQSDVAVTGLKALAYKDSLAFSEITGTASASQIPTLAISKISGLQTALDGKQPLDADLTAIAGLSGTSGFLKKTAANTWSLDTNTYLTTGTAASTYQPLDSDLTAIAAISTGTGLLKRSVSGSTVSWTIDTNTYLTGITSTMVTNALGYTPANVTALANYVLKDGDTMTGNLTMGANSVVFNSSHSSTWANPQNSGLRILNTVGQSATGAPGNYHIGLSVSGYYGFQLASYGGLETNTFLFRNTGSGGTANEWVTIWHTGNLTLASLAGNTAKGSTSLPIYYTGSALAPITDIDLLSQSTGYVKANRVYLTSSIYFYTETVGGTVCVRLNAPFITAGDQIVISGTPGGGGGGGATTLAGLDDVAITSVANGQLLQYNGSKWVNVAASSVGGVTSVAGYTGAVTAAQIATALTSAGYKLTDTTYTNGTGISLSGTTFSLNVSGAKTALGLKALAYKDSLAASDIPDLSGTYLPLSGGQINGTTASPLTINTTASNNYLYFATGGTSRGNIGYYSATIGMVFQCGDSYINIADGGELKKNNAYTFWHSGNFTPSDYLPLTGGTIKNGTVTEPLNIDSNSEGSVGMYFRLSGVNKAWVGYMNNSYGATIYSSPSQKYLGIKDDGTPHYQGNTLLHVGNYTSYTPILNSASTHATNSSVIYAPTTSGNAGQILISLGAGAPAWTSVARGATNKPIYIDSTGVLTEGVACLPLAGGTLQAASDNLLKLNNTTANTTNSFLQFQANDADLAEVGYWSTLGAYLQNEHGEEKHTLNLSDAGGLYFDTYTVWHSGNDGASSGLDADLLDGQHGSYYATASAVSTLQGYFTNGAAKTARSLASLGADSGYWYDTEYPIIAQWDDATHLRLKCLNAAGTVSYDVRVNAADKFVTSRTLWGQSFDGTANVTGALSSVTNIDSLMYFDTANSSVGVGTTSPTAKVHISNATIGSTLLRLTGKNYSYVALSDTSGNEYGTIELLYGANFKSLAGDIHFATTNGISIGGQWNAAQFRFTADGKLGIGNPSPSQALDVAGAGRFYGAMTSGISLYLHNTTTASSWIQFGHNNTVLGWVGVTNAYSIVVQNASGTNVMYVNTSGTLATTGDQVVSSDRTLKENLTPVTYSVSDIAKARAVEFDWKDGRGHSMGSIAQDWLSIAPALVHGEEGNMSLAYGQLALVNTIIEAREIETLKARVAELEAEVKRLRS